jgi:hypothetical protein
MDNSPDERRPPAPKTQSPSPTQEDGEETACSLIRVGIISRGSVGASAGADWSSGSAGIMAMVVGGDVITG